MASFPRLLACVLLLSYTAACTLIVDVDRSKIKTTDTVDASFIDGGKGAGGTGNGGAGGKGNTAGKDSGTAGAGGGAGEGGTAGEGGEAGSGTGGVKEAGVPDSATGSGGTPPMDAAPSKG